MKWNSECLDIFESYLKMQRQFHGFTVKSQTELWYRSEKCWGRLTAINGIIHFQPRRNLVRFFTTKLWILHDHLDSFLQFDIFHCNLTIRSTSFFLGFEIGSRKQRTNGYNFFQAPRVIERTPIGSWIANISLHSNYRCYLLPTTDISIAKSFAKLSGFASFSTGIRDLAWASYIAVAITGLLNILLSLGDTFPAESDRVNFH